MAKPAKAAGPKRPPGRVSTYTEELGFAICSRIAAGETLIEICEDPDMPAEVTVRGWDLKDRMAGGQYNGFASLYARSRLMQIEHEVDEIKTISNRTQIGEITTVTDGPDGTTTKVQREDMIAHRRLQIDARKWRASKIAWRDYGERLSALNEAAEGKSEDIKITGGLPDDD